MNYARIYDQLILRAKSRPITGYVERHHIIPRCLSGGDEPENLVPLTAREHFIAHLLLVKMYPGNMKLVKSVVMMCIGQTERKIHNRLYGKIRELFAKAQSESQTGEGNSQYGTRWSWLNKDGDYKRVAFVDVQKYLDDGWALGMKPKVEKKPNTYKGSRRKWTSIECIICKKKFEVRLCYSNRKFCSLKCNGEGKKNVDVV